MKPISYVGVWVYLYGCTTPLSELEAAIVEKLQSLVEDSDFGSIEAAIQEHTPGGSR